MAKKSITPVKDVVHGYIPLSPLEKIILDSRHFQRLHFILQNSSTYTAYPNNKNSRFSHSLGVAHVAGEMFRSAMNNSSKDTFLAGIEAMTAVVGRYIADKNANRDELEKSWMNCVGYQFAFQHSPIDNSGSIGNIHQAVGEVAEGHPDPLFVLNTFGVAVRVCGLIHDIGHLPMSHIFENALEGASEIFERYEDSDDIQEAFSQHYDQLDHEIFSATRDDAVFRLDGICASLGIDEGKLTAFIDGLPIHERRGIQIFDAIIHEVENSNDCDRSYMLLVFDIAKRIMFSKRGNGVSVENNIFPCFRDIISSQLDADRIDYTLRDPIESGVTDRTFDVTRLLSQFVLTFETPDGAKGKGDKVFRICLGYKALSVLETFFHNRFLNYRFIIYHHSVVRMNCVLGEIIRHLIRVCYVDPKSKTAKLLDGFGLVKIHNDDDISKNELLPNYSNKIVDETWLRSVILEVRDLIENEKVEKLFHLKDLIETFLYRLTTNLHTMWKSEIDYENASKKLDVDLHDSPYIVKAEDKIVIEETIATHAQSHRDDLAVFWTILRPKIYHQDSEEISIIDEQGRLWEAGTVSPYLRSLTSIAQLSPNFHVSFFSHDLKHDKDKLRECGKIEADLVKKIADGRIAKIKNTNRTAKKKKEKTDV